MPSFIPNFVARSSLQWKAIVFISVLVVVVSAHLSFYFLRKSGTALTANFQTVGEGLTKTLANKSRAGMLGFDGVEVVQSLLDEVLAQDKNVLYAIVTDKSGAPLAEKFREEGLVVDPKSSLGLALSNRADLARSITNVFGGYQTAGDKKILHVAVPAFDEQARLGSAQIIFSTDSTDAAIREAFITGTALTLVIVLGGLAVTFYACRRAVRPIREMARAASKIAQGDLTQRVNVRSHDEIGVLANTFNHMAESLDDMTRGLEDKVKQRTEALRLQQEQLREVNLELERATQHKSDFVANMSHELRTPLNAVIGFSEVLLEQMFGPLTEKQEEYVNDILSSGRHLLSLINDILDLSKVEAGKMELEPSVFDLRKIIEGSLVMVKERAMNHGIALTAEVGAGLGLVSADERKIKQIIFNLLSNAVKFTPDKGAVKLHGTIVGDEIHIAVTDTGLGVPESEQEKIFQEFHQVSGGNLTAKAEGTGLGLTLCKKFAELHGGRIWVKSVPGQGSTFTLGLPRQKLEVKGGGGVAALEKAEPALASLPPAASVLVFEPDAEMAGLLASQLQEAGFAVEQAGNETDAWDKLTRLRPGAIVMDVLRPRADGWSFLTRLRKDASFKDVPVIAVSVADVEAQPSQAPTDSVIERLHALGLQALSVPGRNTPVRILAIDDDPRTTELLAAALEPVGFEVIKAGSGAEGLEIARQQRPDLIVLDLLMPGMNGFEVIDQLEKARLTDQMPVILFTVKHLSAEEKQRLKGRIAGVAEKGAFNRDAFVSIVGKVLQRAQQFPPTKD